MIVLETTRKVVEQASQVSIDDDAIARWARETPEDRLRSKTGELFLLLSGSPAKLANLILLVDSLNFCFWSSDPIRFEWRGRTYRRFEAMFASLAMAARYEPGWFDPQFWLEAPADEIRKVLSGTGELLLMDDRVRIIRETARTLLDRFDGQFINAVDSVAKRAWPLAVLLMTEFDSFRDVATYRRQPVYFMKRAQICALDVAIAWQVHEHPPMSGLEELTAFADYRVPQALRNLGILRLVPELAAEIDGENELPAGGEAEVEIRAATIQAVDRMVRALAAEGKPRAAWQIDCCLWEHGRGPDIPEKHHRTRTVYY